MREHTHAGMSLYGSAGSRKYLNAAERRRFAKAALRTPLEVQLFCIVLSLTGGRNPRRHTGSNRHRQRRCKHCDVETPQARHGPASPLAPERYR